MDSETKCKEYDSVINNLWKMIKVATHARKTATDPGNQLRHEKLEIQLYTALYTIRSQNLDYRAARYEIEGQIFFNDQFSSIKDNITMNTKEKAYIDYIGGRYEIEIYCPCGGNGTEIIRHTKQECLEYCRRNNLKPVFIGSDMYW